MTRDHSYPFPPPLFLSEIASQIGHRSLTHILLESEHDLNPQTTTFLQNFIDKLELLGCLTSSQKNEYLNYDKNTKIKNAKHELGFSFMEFRYPPSSINSIYSPANSPGFKFFQNSMNKKNEERLTRKLSNISNKTEDLFFPNSNYSGKLSEPPTNEEKEEKFVEEKSSIEDDDDDDDCKSEILLRTMEIWEDKKESKSFSIFPQIN